MAVLPWHSRVPAWPTVGEEAVGAEGSSRVGLFEGSQGVREAGNVEGSQDAEKK